MHDDTSKETRGARGERGQPLAELGLPLEELVRRGGAAFCSGPSRRRYRC